MYLMDQWGQDRPFEGINEHGVFIGAAGIPDDLSPSENKSVNRMEWIFAESFASSSSGPRSTAEALEIFRSVPISYDLEVEPGTVGHNIRQSFSHRRSNRPCRELGGREELFYEAPVGREGLSYHQFPPFLQGRRLQPSPHPQEGDDRCPGSGFRDEAFGKVSTNHHALVLRLRLETPDYGALHRFGF